MATSIHRTGGSFRAPTLEHATVGEVMHPGVVTCPPSTDLATVARTMATHHIHCVVVSGIGRDAGGEHLSWGMLTDLDLLAARREAAFTSAGEAARTPIVTVSPDDRLEEAAQQMVSHRLTHLLVVAPGTGEPAGIVSTLDVAGTIAWGEV